VHNRSSVTFTPDELNILALGLKFVPTPRPSPPHLVKQRFQQFARSMRLKLQFYDADSKQSSPFDPRFFVPHPNFQPSAQHPALEAYLSKTAEHLDRVLDTSHRSVRNLTAQQRKFIYSLANRDDLVVKPADKGLGLVILDRSWYLAEANRQLADRHTYAEIRGQNGLPTDIIELRLREVTSRLQKAGLMSDAQANFVRHINSNTAKLPKLYLIPKVHKDPLRGRPIVSSPAWLTTPASVWLDWLLQPIVAKQPAVLRDSKSLVQQLEQQQFPRDCVLITADVRDLFTVIPNADGVQAINELLTQDGHSAGSRFLITMLLKIVLNCNYFRFGDKLYVQKTGTAMGTPVSVSYANGFMARRFDCILLQRFADNILMLKRFLDDVFIVLSPACPLAAFTAALSEIHPSLQLTVVTSAHHAEFLDLRIYKGPRFLETGTLDLAVHQKALNKYLYLPFRSYHPWPVKTGFIRTELKRYVRNSSSNAGFNAIRHDFWFRLRNRGFPISVLNREFSAVRYSQRAALLQPNAPQIATNARPLVFKAVHNPTFAAIPMRRVLTEHWHLLAPLTDVFPEKPIIAVSREKNLRDILCRARL